jgi:hypothetical protein
MGSAFLIGFALAGFTSDFFRFVADNRTARNDGEGSDRQKIEMIGDHEIMDAFQQKIVLSERNIERSRFS